MAGVSKDEARTWKLIGLMVRDARRCRAPHHEEIDRRPRAGWLS